MLVELLGGARAEPLSQAPPEFGLPEQVLGEGLVPVGVLAVRPGFEHMRAVGGVGAEQAGEVSGAGPAAAAAVVVGAVAEVLGQDGAPGLGRAGVDDLEQRPDR